MRRCKCQIKNNMVWAMQPTEGGGMTEKCRLVEGKNLRQDLHDRYIVILGPRHCIMCGLAGLGTVFSAAAAPAANKFGCPFPLASQTRRCGRTRS